MKVTFFSKNLHAGIVMMLVVNAACSGHSEIRSFLILYKNPNQSDGSIHRPSLLVMALLIKQYKIII